RMIVMVARRYACAVFNEEQWNTIASNIIKAKNGPKIIRWGGVHVESRTRNECCAGSQITGIATALYVTAVIHHIHMRFRSALPSSATLKTGFEADAISSMDSPHSHATSWHARPGNPYQGHNSFSPHRASTTVPLPSYKVSRPDLGNAVREGVSRATSIALSPHVGRHGGHRDQADPDWHNVEGP